LIVQNFKSLSIIRRNYIVEIVDFLNE